jgi:pimeloyl-ACP methyl ester carboxylesterase
MGSVSWLCTALHLEATFDVIAPDAWGHGQSSRAKDSFSIPNLAADVARLKMVLGFERRTR